ncbi:MAG TPA: hypothetical protein VGG48_09410 [Rhizomicrobium sp.]|jgi:hypothetical protein
MVAKIVSLAILVSISSAMIFFGVGFAAFAFFSWLAAHVGVAGAAAITAFLLLLLPLIIWVVLKLRRPPRREDALFAIFGGMAKDRPLIALAGAAVAGILAAFFRPKSR